MHLSDEMLDHFLRNLKIRDHAFAHGADGFDIAGGFSQHLLSFLANGKNLLPAANFHNRHNRRFVQYNATPLNINQRIRRTQIDRHIGRKHTQQIRKHAQI